MPLRFIGALALAFAACLPLVTAGEARAETRTLKLYFIHTKERAEITFKKNGRYVASGLTEINRFLRDWRQNEPTKMSPELLDILWETYQNVRGRDYIHVVSAYRSPKTNSMLRSRSNGVAQKSQHMLGRAIDFYIPGVSLKNLRDAGLRAGGGGVGYYPKSGSPFVHLDVGNVRHWPRMSRNELVSVFPNGRTLHVPSDGKPLPGYEQAMAAYKSRKRGGGPVVQMASTAESGSRRSGGGFLSALFGGGVDEEEESGGAMVASAREPVARGEARPPRATASRQRDSQGEPLPGVQTGPAVDAAAAPRAPAAQPPAALPKVVEPEPVLETPEQIIAALPARIVPLPQFAPRAVAVLAPPAAAEPAVVAALVPPAEIPASARAAIIAGVPVPSARPANGPPALSEAPAAQVQTADAAGQIRRSAIAAIIAKAAGQAPEIADVKAVGNEVTLAAFAPVPELRPSAGPMAELVAALPQNRPEVVLPQEIRAGVLANAKGARVARVAAAGEPGGPDVKTTPKASKPGPSDQKADRRPVVLPVEEVASRWALETAGRLTRSIASSKERSLAYNAIRTAPKQVYTAGFAPVAAEPDPARFSGNAVTFLAVARFGEE